MAHQLNEKIKTFSNKILLLNYLRNNFGISREALEEIQKSCNKLRKLMEECKKNGKVQKKNYEFLLNGNILYAKYGSRWFNKLCLVLPTFVAELVLRHFHVEKRLHVSAKQIATLFGQNFYCFNLEEICRKITDQCLHCSTHFVRNKQTKALGETRMFTDMWTPNVCWTLDTMFLPPSQGYTHILLGVEAISSYIVLYPMRGTNVDEVIRCMHIHLTVFPRSLGVNLRNSFLHILYTTCGRSPRDHRLTVRRK